MATGPEAASMPRRILRIALQAATWLVVVSGVVLLLVVLVNLRDEELTPEAKALAQWQPPNVPKHQNAYLALVGFDAPAGVDPISEGARIIATNAAAAQRDPTGEERARNEKSKPPEPGDGRLHFAGDMDTLCDPLSKKPCLPSPVNAAEIRAMTAANAELVARYTALQELPMYANTSALDLLFQMPSGGWGGVRRLLFTQAALDTESGNAERALAFLAKDMALWRNVLASGSGLIDEMIAVRMLSSSLALLSEFIAMPTFDVRRHQTQLRQMLAPLTPAERNSAPVFHREYALSSKVITMYHLQAVPPKDTDWSNWTQMKLLYKLNASLNESATFFVEVQSLASHPPADFAVQREKLQRSIDVLSKPGVTWVYNPIGKTLVAIAGAPYAEFIARVFDVAAYVQLVRAQLEVRLADVPAEKVPLFLANAGPEARNPYDDQPFAWDAAERTLTFEPKSQRVLKEWKFKAVVPPPTTVAAR